MADDSMGLIAGRYRTLPGDDGVVEDTVTGLQWMRCSLGQTWDGNTCVGEPLSLSCEGSSKAASDLNESGGYGGHRDWRVPTITELMSLVYCSNTGEIGARGYRESCCETEICDCATPTIVGDAFPNTPQSYFWSCSPDPNYSNYAWFVNFLDGYTYDCKRFGTHHVRLVRGGNGTT